MYVLNRDKNDQEPFNTYLPNHNNRHRMWMHIKDNHYHVSTVWLVRTLMFLFRAYNVCDVTNSFLVNV